MLFYVRRHTGADGLFEWYVLNGHTRRRASKFFPTRAAAAAERAKLQVKLDLAKSKSAQASAEGGRADTRPTKITHQRPALSHAGHPTGRVGLPARSPQRRGCRPIISERDRQARCIFAQPGHRKSPARERG